MEKKVFVYTKRENDALLSEIIKKYPLAKATKNELVAQEMSINNIVVVLSQLNESYQNKININNSFFYVGVRIKPGLESKAIIFDSTSELFHQIEIRKKNEIEEIKEAYLKSLKPLNSNEYEYLNGIIEDLSKYEIKRIGEENRINKDIRIHCEKKFIAVYDNPKIAISIANGIKKGKILLMEGDLLRPKLDEYLKIKKLETSIESHLTGIDNTGFNIAIDSIRKNSNIRYDLPFIVKKYNNIDVLLGNYNPLNYEHYQEESLKLLFDSLRSIYDFIVISLGNNIYDYLTLLSLNICDYNIICIGDSQNEIRWIKQMVNILEKKQFIDKSKHKIYRKKTPLITSKYSNDVIKAIFKETFYGNIPIGFKKDYRLTKKVLR